MEFKNLSEFTKAFPDEKAARTYFEGVRFADGDFCPHCGNEGINRFADGLRYRCKACKKDFTIKTGTIFEESRMGLRTWFLAIWLLTTNKKGISSMNLAKQLGVTQKTAWFMDHRIREAMGPDKVKLRGDVEVDEMYVGGRHVQKGSKQAKGKVVGAVERGGTLKAEVVYNFQHDTMMGMVGGNVEKGSHLITDGHPVYRWKAEKAGYRHSWVNHMAKQWVRGPIHTGTIDGFWGQFKRGYHGTYHYMSEKHLQRYVNEFTFRYNRRKDSIAHIFGDTLSRMAGGAKLSWKELTYEPNPRNS